MKRHHLLIANLLLAAATLQAGGHKPERSTDAAAFARLKTLVGEWGTALIEKESGEKMPAMLTVYHLDGDRLLLTHYCHDLHVLPPRIMRDASVALSRRPSAVSTCANRPRFSGRRCSHRTRRCAPNARSASNS